MKKNYHVRTICLFLFTLGVLSNLYSQVTELYIPINIQKTYNAGTRSIDGKPGPKYWQNYSSYDIKAKVNPETKILEGSETIEYFNNSPDTLYSIVVRLYQEIFKREGIRDFIVNPNALNDGVSIDKILLNGKPLVTTESLVSRRPTVMQIYLTDYLLPGQSITLGFEWSFEIPSIRKIRMGAYSESALFIAYWYPQISVYDDIDGWDFNEYHGRAEFYNDFCSYNVEIEVPYNYVVWATGEQQNYEEVFQQEVIEKFSEAKKSNEVVNILSPQNYEDDEVMNAGDWITWKFAAKGVPDFSFSMSNNYVWDAVSIEVDSVTKRRVLASAIYPDSIESYKEVAMFSRETIRSLSTEIPGVPFPYPNFTTFCNGGRDGGMETPMLANNGAPTERYRSIGLTAHEIAHTYFPFHMGINERKYAFMEEGMASFFPRLIVKNIEPSDDYLARRVESFVQNSGHETEMPPISPNYVITKSPDYRTATYNRPAIAYFLLYDYFGEEKMRKIFQEYARRWEMKHPMPHDFFFTVNEAAGENLDWFWKPWFFEFGYPDLSIKNVNSNDGRTTITIEKKGALPIPISLSVVFADGSEEEIYKPMSVWKNGNSEVDIQLNNANEIRKVELGSPHIPDVYSENNLMEF